MKISTAFFLQLLGWFLVGSNAFTPVPVTIAPCLRRNTVERSRYPSTLESFRRGNDFHVTNSLSLKMGLPSKPLLPSVVKNVAKNLRRQWLNLWSSANLQKRCRALRRRAFVLILSFAVVMSNASGGWAVTGGRAGGTFKSTHRPSVSRSFSPSRSYPTRMMPPQRRHGSRYVYASPPIGVTYAHNPTALVATTMSKSDVFVLGSVAALVTYGMVNARRNGSSLHNTMGATSSAVRFAMNIPDRYDPNSIIHRINAIAERTDTSTRTGVQTLISEVSLELLRQQASLQAAWSDSNHYMTPNAALKDFQRLSVESRTRYDQETMSNFNNDYSAETRTTRTIGDGKATMAVVSLHFATEGEDVSHFKNLMRADVLNMLRWMAANIPVTSLLAGEVLWSPQKPDDTLSKRDIDERYPELTPLI